MISDQALLRQFVQGHREAFDALYHRYAPKVHATSLRLTGRWEDAEDVLQEVFLKLARNASSIRARDAISSWIYRTTVNAALDCRRKRRNAAILQENDLPGKVVVMASLARSEQRLHAEEKEATLQRIEGLILELPERQAAVVVLRGFQGLNHREIAEALGISESSAKSQFSRGCRRLRELLRREEEAGNIDLGMIDSEDISPKDVRKRSKKKA